MKRRNESDEKHFSKFDQLESEEDGGAGKAEAVLGDLVSMS